MHQGSPFLFSKYALRTASTLCFIMPSFGVSFVTTDWGNGLMPYSPYFLKIVGVMILMGSSSLLFLFFGIIDVSFSILVHNCVSAIRLRHNCFFYVSLITYCAKSNGFSKYNICF